MQKNSFVFYRSFYEAINELQPQDKLLILEAICQFALDGIEPILLGMPKMCFTLIKPQLEANTRKAENGKLGGKHGFKGGRPKKDNNPIGVSDNNPIGVKTKTPNANVNVNVNANVKEGTFDKVLVVPDFVPLDMWNSFLEMRKAIKKPPTHRAKELLIGNLAKLNKAGYDITKVLEQSICNNWIDLYPPKKPQPLNNKSTVIPNNQKKYATDGEKRHVITL